jgi:rod shape-determining protein MreC
MERRACAMRNIFLFIRRFSNLLFFLLLQGFSIYLIVHYNKYHNAVFSGTMNQLTGSVNTQYNKVGEYFALKAENAKLAKANEQLRNSQATNFDRIDTGSRIVVDSVAIDTLGARRKWRFYQAKVVSNSVAMQNNMVVLGRGSSQQLKEGMGVVDPLNGVVGKIIEVSDDYAVVLSLLSKTSDFKVNAKLKKGGEIGSITWDGREPNVVTLNDIRKSANVKKGDTVYTSGLTTTFQYGLMIGTVEQVVPEKSNNNFKITVRTAANFYNLQYVYVIENLEMQKIEDILKNAAKKTSTN